MGSDDAPEPGQRAYEAFIKASRAEYGLWGITLYAERWEDASAPHRRVCAAVEAALATPPASPAATDKEVARMVERLRKPVYTFHINEKGGPNITVEGENRFAMEREVSLLADAGREAADLLARVAWERDEQARLKHEAYDRNNSALADALQRAEAAEKVLAIANRGGLDLLYAVRKAIGWTDKHALSLLPDECARLKKAAARNAPIWPGKDFDHFEPGGFDDPTGAN